MVPARVRMIKARAKMARNAVKWLVGVQKCLKSVVFEGNEGKWGGYLI